MLRQTLSAAVVLCLPLILKADDAAAAPDAAASEAASSETEIAKWIEDLGSDDFTTREAASRALTKVGKEAIPAVVEAAEKGFGLEAPSRSVKILTKLAKSEDEATAAAAKEGLEKLTKADRKFVARLAKAALEEPNPQPAVNPFGARFGGGRIVINGIAAGNGVRIQQRVVNGQREIDVDDNGTKIKITDTNGTNIVVKVEEQVNGQAQTKEYKGDDLADLKKKHPEGAKIYEKYARGNVIPGIRLNGARIQALPIAPRVRQIIPRRNVQGAIDEIDQSIEELKKLAEDGKVPAGSLDDALKRLEEAKQKLENAAG